MPIRLATNAIRFSLSAMGQSVCAVVFCSGYQYRRCWSRGCCSPKAVDFFGEALNPSRVCKPLQGGAPHTYRAEMAAACSS